MRKLTGILLIGTCSILVAGFSLVTARDQAGAAGSTRQLADRGGFAGNGGRAAVFGNRSVFQTNQSQVGNIGSSIVLNTDRSPPPPDNYAIASFVLAHAHRGAGDTWGENIASYVDPGVDISTNQIALEVDQSIGNREYGARPLAFTAADKEFIAVPVLIRGVVGKGLYRSTAAILVEGIGGQTFNRGIAFTSDSIRSATIQDATNSATVLSVSGHHRVGIDLTRASGMTSALSVPNAVPINFSNGGGGTVSIFVDTEGQLHVGDGGRGIKLEAPVVLPRSGPSFAGNSTARAAGLAPGSVYRTPDGTLKVAF